MGNSNSALKAAEATANAQVRKHEIEHQTLQRRDQLNATLKEKEAQLEQQRKMAEISKEKELQNARIGLERHKVDADKQAAIARADAEKRCAEIQLEIAELNAKIHAFDTGMTHSLALVQQYSAALNATHEQIMSLSSDGAKITMFREGMQIFHKFDCACMYAQKVLLCLTLGTELPAMPDMLDPSNSRSSNSERNRTGPHKYSADRRNAERCFKGDACKNQTCFRMHPRDVSAEPCRHGEQCKFHKNSKLMCNRSHCGSESAPSTP
jgi:hypothetical protein